jgi:hypothetical protein
MPGTIPKTIPEIWAWFQKEYPFSCEAPGRLRPENFERHCGGSIDFARLPSETPFIAKWFFKTEHDMQRFKKWVWDQVKQEGAHDAS